MTSVMGAAFNRSGQIEQEDTDALKGLSDTERTMRELADCAVPQVCRNDSCRALGDKAQFEICRDIKRLLSL